MRAIDVMTSQVVTAMPQTTVQAAAELMINNHISGLPIVEGDRQLVGIVTEGDLLRRVETGTERHAPRGASGFRQTPGWLPTTSSRTRGEWPIS